MYKLPTLAITVQNESDRSKNIYSELRKLEPWCSIIVNKFYSPCKNYRGTSDNNHCVQKNLYNNHQKCAQYILDNNVPYGLVLESDFKVLVDQPTLDITMNALLKWLDKHSTQFDILLLGGHFNSIDNQNALNDSHVIRVDSYSSKTHAVIYSRSFCQQIVDNDWPGMHFDIYWSNHRKDIRMFMTRDMVIGVNHSRHMRQMNRGHFFAFLFQTYTNTIAFKLSFIIISMVLIILVLFLIWKNTMLSK